ncbi:unnamed protein product [Closterium sp. NIES-53]
MARLTAPLTDLQRKGVVFTWGEKEHAAFSALKTVLCSSLVMRIANPHRPLEEVTDASDIAIGAVLLHDFGNGLQPITYESRKLHPPKKNYPIHDREMLAIVHVFKVCSCSGVTTGPKTRQQLQRYVASCPTCQLMKSPRKRPTGQLQPIPPPERAWQQVMMDFVTGLPVGGSGNDAILTKMAHFAALKKTITAEETARLFISTVVQQHGIPASIISDPSTKFTSNFWRNLWQQFGKRLQFSSSYHLETDGQAERTNQTMEQLI